MEQDKIGLDLFGLAGVGICVLTSDLPVWVMKNSEGTGEEMWNGGKSIILDCGGVIVRVAGSRWPPEYGYQSYSHIYSVGVIAFKSVKCLLFTRSSI